MPFTRLRAIALLSFLLLAIGAGSALGDGALVEVNGIVLRADGGFQPQTLPGDRYAPIEFEGHVDITAKSGGAPSALQEAVIEFDRDGRLSVAGLPVCTPETIESASPEEARRACQGALVGGGHVEALVSLPGGPVRAASPLSVFNGPRLAGGPTAVLHARFTTPVVQTYAIVVPIEQISSGRFRYRARLALPPLAGGLGALTHIDVKIGRRYNAGGKRRSYVAARCGDNIIQTHGRFGFADGTVISGQVEKYCRSK